MDKKKKWLIGSLLVAVLLVGFTYKLVTKKAPSTSKAEPEIWVISDNHFFAKSLHDDGEAFEKFNKTTVGKDILYSEDLLGALVKKAVKEKPDALVITGDTTLNGEKESLKKMASVLAPLKKAEIPVFGIPGNHDIHDGWARMFYDKKQYVIDQITPGTFRQYFPDGYKQSVSQDKYSLSYTVDMGQYRLFLMDSNLYTLDPSENAPITQGRYKKETLGWMEEQLEAGKKAGKTPILFSHHNMLSHSKQVHTGFVLNNAEAVLDLVKTYDIPLSLSGHTHVQDIMESEEIPGFFEATTSAFSIAESHVAKVTLGKDELTYQAEIFDPRPYFTKAQLKNPDLKNYPTYLKDIFLHEGQQMAYNELFSHQIYDDKIVDPIANLTGEMNVTYFVGKNLTEKEQAEIKQSEGYQLMEKHAPRLERFILSKFQHETSQDPMSLKIKMKQDQ